MIKISPKANPNYLAQVVKIENLRKHSNADKLQICTVQANNVIVSTNTKIDDIYVYFPLESTINKEFLSWSNSFEDKKLNQNNEIRGFFNSKGRVRAVKLRGEKSEGYLAPQQLLKNG